MATPTLRAMRRHFGPQAHLVGILRPYLADVLAGTGWLDEQWFFDPRATDRGLHAWAVARRMRARTVRHRRAPAKLVPRGAGGVAGRSARADRIRALRPQPAVDRQALSPPGRAAELVPMPVVTSYLELAYALGCGDESPRLELATVEADERSADQVFGRLGLSGNGRVVALNSSGAYGAAKLWPVEYFGQLARRIVDELDHDVLVTCGPKERDVARRIVGLAGGRPRVLDGRSADGPGHGQGVHPPLSVDGFDRQRPAARGRRAGPAGDYVVRPDVAHLEREPHAAGGQSDARPRLHRLSPAGLPA